MNKRNGTRFLEPVNTFTVKRQLNHLLGDILSMFFLLLNKQVYLSVLRFVRAAITKSRDSDRNTFCNVADVAIKFEPEETITGQKLRNVRVCIYIRANINSPRY